MIKSKINQLIVISAFCLVVITMGLYITAGSYSNALKLANNTNTEKIEPTLDVALKENTYLESIGSVESSNKSFNKTTANYTISLNPGEYYEFTIAVANQGTLDAKLTSIKSTGFTKEQEQAVNYTVYYGNSFYPNTIEDLNIGLGKNATDYLRIRVEYPVIEGTTQSPLTDINLSTTLEFVEL